MVTLEKILKSPTMSLEEIIKHTGISFYFRLIEPYSIKEKRITEDGFKRLLEDTPQDIGVKILKNTATLTKILKS